MSKNSALTDIRHRLKSKEKVYRERISLESDEFEKQASRLVKSFALIGGGLLIGFGIFKLVDRSKSPRATSIKKKTVKKVPVKAGRSILKSAIIDKLIAFAIQLGFSYLSKKIKQDDRDSKSASGK